MDTLKSAVRKHHKTNFVFADVNNDLGVWCAEIDSHTRLVKMAYGYARRIAVDALYAQGLVNKDVREHVLMIFKALQAQTGQTAEFQEAAYAQAVEFLKGYNWLFTSIFAKSLSLLASSRAPDGILADADLFTEVLTFSYAQFKEDFEVAEAIDARFRQDSLSRDQAFEDAYAEIKKDIFDDLPLYHINLEEAERYAKENSKVVYKDSSGYFTANKNYVPPPQFVLDDEDIGF